MKKGFIIMTNCHVQSTPAKGSRLHLTTICRKRLKSFHSTAHQQGARPVKLEPLVMLRLEKITAHITTTYQLVICNIIGITLITKKITFGLGKTFSTPRCTSRIVRRNACTSPSTAKRALPEHSPRRLGPRHVEHALPEHSPRRLGPRPVCHALLGITKT